MLKRMFGKVKHPFLLFKKDCKVDNYFLNVIVFVYIYFYLYTYKHTHVSTQNPAYITGSVLIKVINKTRDTHYHLYELT